MFALITLIGLFIIELIYFKIADHYNIIDQPNHRSSHSSVTIRGGGIIFGVAGLISFFLFGFHYLFFSIGLFLIALISFLDDMHTLNNKVRLLVHGLSVLLLFVQLDVVYFPWYFTAIAAVVVIGTINAYNFMDGINGITGGYSLLLLGTLYYINEEMVDFTSPELLITVMISLLVFNLFNFRKKAKCFAGDVGSVSIAFIIVFLLGQLIFKTQNPVYILFLLMYGLDTVTTIFFRLIRKENIFKAHRSHFYQFLANEKKWPQLVVVALYLVVQLLINLVTLFIIQANLLSALLLMLICSVVFIILRFRVEGREHLFNLKLSND
ncbi:glycosyltransferase family 4 protein [Pedobacter psychrodurus]|uniref:Glycosyltransferase family 4 protein n=1 Tax=Pedobacter psychrodurus TaxID=2530456 RepID=A0A4R0PP45_9SPHI|nr:glycosyltransferase family 4 protein [Pedobacter psychrodurus]